MPDCQLQICLLAALHITSQQVSPWQNNFTLPFLPILWHTGDKVKSIHHLLHLSMPQLWISVCNQEAIWWWWALLCNCYWVQGCLKVPIDLDFICRRMCRTLSRRADNSEPQIAVPDFGEWLIDFRKFCFCKMLGFCKVAWGEFGNFGISTVSRYWAILSRTPKCGVAFLPWEKEGYMKHQRQSYKNTLVSKIHQPAFPLIYGTNLHEFAFISTHHYFLLMDRATRRVHRATASFFHHPLQKSSHFLTHSIIVLQPEFHVYIFLHWQIYHHL